MTHESERVPGQATVEFALVLPLFIGCTVLVVAATLAGLRTLTLSDLARDAARAATVAEVPCAAAARIVGDAAEMHCEIATLPASGAHTVQIRLTDRLPFTGSIDGWIPLPRPTATVTMLVEPPPVLG